VTRVQTTGDSGVGYGSVDTYVQSFVYNDALARLTSTVTTISPVAGGTAEPPFMQSLTYDGLGRVATTTDATGGRAENMYSSHGFLRRVRDAAAPATVYWELLASNERGQATRERRHGNAKISTRRDYDALTGRLQAILSGLDNGSSFVNPVQNLSYQYLCPRQPQFCIADSFS